MNKIVSLTFDVEDWFQVENLRSVFPHETWDSQELRVEKNTHKILDLLDGYNVKATFFVLGWVAERVPSLVKEISKRGHEIACHGYSHNLNYLLTMPELKEDIYKGKSLLEDINGQRVTGYRAPSFSISDEVMEVLSELDFVYDSSYHPFSKHDRYGRLSDCSGHRITRHKTGILELPLPVTKVCGQEIPVSGGGYFRLMPFALYSYLAHQYLGHHNYYVFYLHPWEIDHGQPKVTYIPWAYKFRHYYGLGKTEAKLRSTLNEIAPFCQTLKDCLSQY